MSENLKHFIRHFLSFAIALIVVTGLILLLQYYQSPQISGSNFFVEFITTRVIGPEQVVYISENSKLLIIIFFLAFFTSLLDKSIGMGYGTISSPALLFLGVDTKTVVTSILITEAFNGTLASFVHAKLKNSDITK